MITITNKITGELVDFPSLTIYDLVNTWQQAQEYEAMGKRLKDKLKPLLDKYLPEDGELKAGDYLFRKYTAQSMTYNKAALRKVFDEDTLDLFTTVSRKAVTDYIKKNKLDYEQLAALEDGLEPAGKAYTAIKLEKIA